MQDSNSTILIIAVVGAYLVYTMFVKNRKKQAVSAKLAGSPKIVDVRTPEEFASGAYPGAINIPADTIEANSGRLGDKNAPVVVYCASGMRSRKALRILKAAGFTDVTDAGSLNSMPR